MSHSIFDNRHYVVIPYSEVDNVDFDQVIQTSKDTIRKSADSSKTFVKYIGEMPSSLIQISSKSEEYTYEEIIEILNTEEWNA